MTQEFYLKTQTLYEEFQKRELQHLNSKRKHSSSMMWKKDLNLPLQEYLKRINQRERETEETYRSVMKQMEELDQHTNVMYLQLEKLGVLRNSMSNLMVSNQPFSLGSNLQVYNTTPNINMNPTIPQFDSAELSCLKTPYETKSVSSQTENNMYCDKCNSHVLIPSQIYDVKNVQPSSILSEKNDGQQIAYSSKSQNSDGSLFNKNQNNLIFASPSLNSEKFTRVNQNNSTFVSSSLNAEQLTSEVNQKNSTIVSSSHNVEQFTPKVNENTEASEIGQNSSEESQKENLLSRITFDERQNFLKNELESNKDSAIENAQNSFSVEKEILTELQSSADKNFESKPTDSEANLESFVSKSDAESVNNEFDFLELDTSSKLKNQKGLESYKSPHTDDTVNSDKAGGSEELHLSKPTSKQKKGKHPKPKLDVLDDKSETSGSVSGPHSPNISIASDSDSMYEKGSSLTASAAYQALLGNTVIPTKTKKIESESESEDEIENAFANAVQKTHAKSKSSTQPKKDNPAPKPVDSEPSSKASKPLLTTNPQSKLSKSTRKVLGLDTSSGSEVEMATKPPGKKIDEDSDEFDFYD